MADKLNWIEVDTIFHKKDEGLDVCPAIRITTAKTPRGNDIFSYTHGILRNGAFEARMHIPDNHATRYMELMQKAAISVDTFRINRRTRVPLPEVVVRPVI